MDSREFYNGILSHQEKSDQWVEGAEHLVKLKKLASAHSSSIGSVLQDPSSWPLIVAGATAGSVIASSRTTPRKEYGGKSDPEARLSAMVEKFKGEPEDGFLPKMRNRAVEHAHGIAKAFREHPGWGTGIGAAAGAVLGFGIAQAMGAGGHTKVALSFGGRLGAGALMGGALGLGAGGSGAEGGHPVLSTLGGIAGGAALTGLGGSRVAQRAAGGLAGAGKKAVAPAGGLAGAGKKAVAPAAVQAAEGAAPAALHAAESAVAPAAAQAAAKGVAPAAAHAAEGAAPAAAGGVSGTANTMASTPGSNPALAGAGQRGSLTVPNRAAKDVTPSSSMIPGQTPHPLAGQGPVIQDSANAGIMHSQDLLRKGARPRLQDNYDIQQHLKSSSPAERQETIERIRGSSPQDADALAGHYLRSPTRVERGTPTSMTAAIPNVNMQQLQASKLGRRPPMEMAKAAQFNRVAFMKLAMERKIVNGYC